MERCTILRLDVVLGEVLELFIDARGPLHDAHLLDQGLDRPVDEGVHQLDLRGQLPEAMATCSDGLPMKNQGHLRHEINVTDFLLACLAIRLE